MIFRLRYLPPALGVIGAIAGMAIVSGLTPKQSKALVPFASGTLSIERLSNLNNLKVSETRFPEGIEVAIAPQSTQAMHGLTGLGSPNWLSQDGLTEYYDVSGTSEGGMIAASKVVVNWAANADTGYELKAVSVWVPSSLMKNSK